MAQPLEYFSHSRLQSFRTCALKFRYTYVDKLTPAFTPAVMVLGSAFHAAVEAALIAMMGGMPLSLDNLMVVAAKVIDDQPASVPIRYNEGEDRDTLIATIRRMLEVWVTWPRPGKLVAVEQDFRVPWPGAPWLGDLVGRVDIVEIDEGAGFVNVVDVKSSRAKYSLDDVQEHSVQLELYRVGLAPLLKDIGLPVRLGLEVVTKAKVPTVTRHYVEEVAEPIERLTKVATVMAEAVEKDLFVPAAPGWYCGSCQFREACRRW